MKRIVAAVALFTCQRIEAMDLAGQYFMKCLAADGRRTDARSTSRFGPIRSGRVHRGHQKRRQPAVDFFVYDDDWQPLIGGLPLADEALAELVAAVRQGSARLVREGLGVQVLARLDLAAAPGASGELIGRADSGPARSTLVTSQLLDRLHGIFGPVRRRAPAHTQADAEGRLTPAFVALLQGFGTFLDKWHERWA
jgi:hypothetical protein